MKIFQGAVYGLSLFLLGLCYALPVQAGPLAEQASATSLPFSTAAFRAGWMTVGSGKSAEQDVVGMQAESTLRAGRLGELLISMALLSHLQQQKINLQDPVNFYLNDFQLLEGHGEIQLRHLLQRQTGLPLRQSHLYLSDVTRMPTLRDGIVQELKPAINAPGEAYTYQSVGDLVGAQLLTELVSQQRNREVSLDEVLMRHFADLKWQQTHLMDAKTGQQYQDLLGATAPPFAYFPAVWSTAPVVHGYVTSLNDLTSLLQRLLAESAKKGQDLSTLGLFPAQVGNTAYYYFDSHLFGQSLRLAVFPEQQAGFVLYYNHADATLAERMTHYFVTQKLKVTLPSTAEKEISPSSWVPLRLRNRDQVSLLKAFDVVQPTYVGVGEAGLIYQGQHWWKIASQTYQNTYGSRLRWDGTNLQELGGRQSLWQVAQGWSHPWTQWGIAGMFVLCFLGFFGVAAYHLWQYEPVVTTDEGESESSEGQNNWDLPLLSALNSVCVWLFVPLFYQGLLGTQTGVELSLAFRNQPPALLIGSLILPLVALISGLILMLLFLSEWKTRQWKTGQRTLYGVQLAMLLMFTVWIASWNLLGFRF